MVKLKKKRPRTKEGQGTKEKHAGKKARYTASAVGNLVYHSYFPAFLWAVYIGDALFIKTRGKRRRAMVDIYSGKACP